MTWKKSLFFDDFCQKFFGAEQFHLYVIDGLIEFFGYVGIAHFLKIAQVDHFLIVWLHFFDILQEVGQILFRDQTVLYGGGFVQNSFYLVSAGFHFVH